MIVLENVKLAMGLEVFISEVLRLFFFKSGLMTEGFWACGNTPDGKDVLTIHRGSETVFVETILGAH